MAAALVVAWMMGATALPATMLQLAVVFCAQVLRRMMFPGLIASIPKSALVQLFPSIRQPEPVTRMPAPTARLAPLWEQVLSRTWLVEPTTIPWVRLKAAVHPSTRQPRLALIP